MAEHGAVRVSDAERERTARPLLAAHGEGRLTLVEYDERVRAAHGAVVHDDLAPLLADLPARPSRPAPGDRREGPSFPFPVPPGMPRPGGRGEVAAWAAASVVNVVIWLVVSLGAGVAVYPWWIWVAGPWGLAMLVGRMAHRTRPGRTALPSS